MRPLHSRGARGPQRPLVGVKAAGGQEAGLREGKRGSSRCRFWRAGGAAPEESASGHRGRRLAPPRGTERAVSEPARETPAAGGASTSEEGAGASGAQRWEPDWGWGNRPGPGEGHPRSSAFAPCPGQVSGWGTPGRGCWEAGGERARGRRHRTPSPPRSCPLAGRPPCPRRGALRDFFERNWKVKRGVSASARTWRGQAPVPARNPHPSSARRLASPSAGTQPVRSRSEAKGLSLRALLAAFVAGAGQTERGMREAAARGRVPGRDGAEEGCAPTGARSPGRQ